MASPNALQRQRAMRRMAMLRARQRGGARRPVNVGATRRPSPVNETKKALLEEVIGILYDTEPVRDASTEVAFFVRSLGTPNLGNATKTYRDTNLETAGQLARPRVHVVTGVRVVISLVTGDALAAPNLSIPTYRDYVAAIRGISGESVLRLEIGSKQYLNMPTFMVPGNVGVSIGGNSGFEGAAAALGITEANIAYSWYTRGDYMSLLPARLRIPSQQGFRAFLSFPSPSVNITSVIANPLFATLGGLKVTVCLDGVSGREVQ